MQNATTANSNGTVLAVDGQAIAHLALNCTASCTGTVNFEGQLDGANFGPAWASQDGTNTLSTTASYSATTGVTNWTVYVGGFKQLRARTSGAPNWAGRSFPGRLPLSPCAFPAAGLTSVRPRMR